MYIQEDKSLETHPLPPFVTTVTLGTSNLMMFCKEQDGVDIGERMLMMWGQLNGMVMSLEEEDG